MSAGEAIWSFQRMRDNFLSYPKGGSIATGQTPDQVGDARPPVYAPLRGLYFEGCNAGARGVGTELAAASAMECVDRVLPDLGRELGRAPAQGTLRAAGSWIAGAAARQVAWATRA